MTAMFQAGQDVNVNFSTSIRSTPMVSGNKPQAATTVLVTNSTQAKWKWSTLEPNRGKAFC